MDRQLLIAIALSALVVIGYQEYVRIFYPAKPHTARHADTTPVEPPTAPAASPLAGAPQSAVPEAGAPAAAPAAEADVFVETPLYTASFASVGARLVSFRLKQYRTTIDPASEPLELVASSAGGDRPLGVTLRGASGSWSDASLAYRPSEGAVTVPEGGDAELVFRGTLPQGGAIEKRFHFRADQYAVEVGVGLPQPVSFDEASLGWAHRPPGPASRYWYEGMEALIGGKLTQFKEPELQQGVVVPQPTVGPEPPPIRWVGYTNPYFISALAPREGDRVRLWLKLDRGEAVAEVLVPIAAFQDGRYPFTVYVGPKDLHALAAAGHNLTRAVDLGWFSFVAEPMLRVLKFFHGLTGNYGLDVILLTVLAKLAMIPLTNKSYQSMREMQKLQPQMKRLQEKYADDREALNKEMMELYRRHNVNPLGGCLPMVVQMPIFIGLYNALLSAVELRHAHFGLWINDLSAPDRLPPVSAPPLAIIAGTEVRIPVLTLLMGASMLVQQRMTPAAGDPVQQRMMMFMPLVFTAMFINFPSGLVIYWLVNNILTIAQQAIMQRARP